MGSGSFSETAGLADISYFYILVPLLAFFLQWTFSCLPILSFLLFSFFDNAVLIFNLWWLPQCLEKANDRFYFCFSMPGSNTIVNVEMKTYKSNSGMYENVMGKCFIANFLQVVRGYESLGCKVSSGRSSY